MNGVTVAHYGWPGSPIDADPAHIIKAALMVVYAVLLAWGERAVIFRGPDLGSILRQAIRPDRLATALGLMLFWSWPATALIAAFLLVLHLWTVYLWLLQRDLNPSLILLGSFVVLIFTGTIALKLPAATPLEAPIGWVDAAFTSTSAVCVTGLIVRDTPTEFTRFGQVVLLILFQLGGLGMILFGSMVALLLGSSISLRAVHAMADTTRYGSATATSVRRLVIFAATVVFGLEALGAVLLYFGWPDAAAWPTAPEGIDDPRQRAFHAVFFSVSGFCNAGFATTSNSLEGLRLHWTTHIVIGGLIAVGALGLPVYANIAQIVRSRLRRRRLTDAGVLVRMSLHTKIVLVTSLVAHVVAMIGIMISAVRDEGEPWSVAALDGHFMSITGTAGFSSVNPAHMGPIGRLSLMFAMFVGGSPGSVAGGIKTVVVGVLAVTAISTILVRPTVDAFGRRVSTEIILKAVTLLVLQITLIAFVAGALLFFDASRIPVRHGIGPFEAIVFETISATSTVGLSLGITPDLSPAGRIALIVGMFVGRVGSLAFLVALVGLTVKRRPRMEFPTEEVVLS